MDERIVTYVDFHNVPEDTFRRRLERFPLDVQKEVAQRVIDLLTIEGSASHSEQLLLDEAHAFVNNTWNFQPSNRAVLLWRLGQLIQRLLYHPGVLGTPAIELWDFLAKYSYPARGESEVEDALEELGEPIGTMYQPAPPAVRQPRSDNAPSESSGFWRRLWEALTD